MKSLVVEDDTLMGRVLERALRDRGHVVDRYSNGEEAWDACQRDEYPLILSDWMLPGMDGLELCRRIRTLPWGSQSIIVIVTVADRPDDLAAVLDAGASDYLSKPFSPRMLQIRLAVVERQAAEVAARRAAEGELVEARAAAAESAAARELIRQQRLLISLISHELRTPLSSVLGFSELLLDRNLVPDNLRAELGAIHAGAIRLNTLVDRIVDLSFLESGEARLELMGVDLAEVLPRWVGDSGNGRVAVDVAPGLPRIHADCERMPQAVQHLVGNAIAVSPPESPIQVNARRVDHTQVAIDVIDRGAGIPAEELHLVFEPLFRTGLAHQRAVPGSGIGLAIVRRVVELHGGQIGVRSNLGTGTTFTIILPAPSEVASVTAPL